MFADPSPRNAISRVSPEGNALAFDAAARRSGNTASRPRSLAGKVVLLMMVLAAVPAAPIAAQTSTGGIECLNWRRDKFPLLDVVVYLGAAGTPRADVIDRDLEVLRARLDWFVARDGWIDGEISVPAAAILGNDKVPHWKTENGALVPGAQVRLYLDPGHARAFRLNPDGSFEYRPADGYFGEDGFSYYYHLGNYCSQPVTVTIEATRIAIVRPDTYDVDAVPPPNVAVLDPGAVVVTSPAAGTWIKNEPFDLKNDCVSPEGRGNVRPKCGVLVNDENIRDSSSINWGNLFTPIATNHGFIVPRRDGSFAYTPNPGFEGQDSFTYSVSAAGPPSIRTGTVTLNVRRRPVAKVYATDDELLTEQDAPLPIAAASLTANDAGAFDINTVTGDTDFAAADPTFGRPASRRTANGTLTIGWQHVDPILGPFRVGSITYTPDPFFAGLDTFHYLARGNGAFAWASVAIEVRNKPDPPVARPDFVRVLPGSVTTIDVLANDSDPDGDILTLQLQPDPLGLWSLVDSAIVFSAPTGAYGTYLYGYGIEDATELAGNTGIVARVTPLMPDSYTMDEDTSLIIAAPGVRANDTACNSCDSSVSVEIVDQPENGSVDLSASGAFTYAPNANFSGVDTFTYRARGGDAEYAIELGLLGVEKTAVTITVVNVPDTPTVVLHEACPQSAPSDPCTDDRDARVVRADEAVRLRGYVMDPDADVSGNLFVDWGDGTPVRILPYPCVPGQFGSAGCEQAVWLESTWAGAVPGTDRMYFDLDHVYGNGAAGSPNTYQISVGAGDETGLADPTGAGTTATVFDVPPTATPLISPTPTATATPTVAKPLCAGDCDGDGMVTVDEILALVSIALGTADAASCPDGIPNGGTVDVASIIQSVNNALLACSNPA
jgi:hypothetical protein